MDTHTILTFTSRRPEGEEEITHMNIDVLSACFFLAIKRGERDRILTLMSHQEWLLLLWPYLMEVGGILGGGVTEQLN